jgi:hypothetical protein
MSNALKVTIYSFAVALCVGCSESPTKDDEQAKAEKSAATKDDALFKTQRDALNQAKLMKEQVEAEQKKQAEALKKIKDDQ